VRTAKSNTAIEILNISETGCLINSRQSLQVGEKIELQIAPQFWLQAAVVRQMEDRFGARFEFRSRSELRQLKQFIETLDAPSNVIPITAARKTAEPATESGDGTGKVA
jgi:hypothetical protein